VALITHCENGECDEAFIAKSVPDELAGAPITCGRCGLACVEPAESSTEPGGDVRA
jgi:hypothetical protein